jgi:ABC-type multidrug transport system ATPase subunit
MTVRGIGKAFGDQQVLTEVSFDVASGEIVGLIGPNGAGKTTLLECVAGLSISIEPLLISWPYSSPREREAASGRLRQF